MTDPATETLRVLTFNIRFDNPADGPNRWRHRRSWVAEIVDGTDIAGLQEARRCPLGWLNRHLHGHRWIGVGRANGRRRGEYAPIFYRASRFSRLDRGTFWLSLQPDVPGSRSWGTSVPRIATWVRLVDRTTDRRVLVLNCHLDHRSAKAREQGAHLILHRLAALAQGDPVIVTGDLNDGRGSDVHRILTGGEPFALEDARDRSASGHTGPDSTWTGFKAVKPGRVIDVVLVSPEVEVLAHESVDEQRKGRFPSDHLPVVATIRL
jgi:endonuclease/exonuclease/phosphatase family metal-dependent hydrolase